MIPLFWWPTTRARLYLQIHVRYLFWYFTCAMTQFSSLLYYDHCPVPRYLIGEVPITLLLNQQTKYWICRCMYVWQTIALVWNITLLYFTLLCIGLKHNFTLLYFTCAMTQFSSLLYYDHCPVPRYLIGEVPITLLLNQQTKYWICRCMYVWQTIALVWNITLIVFATCRRQYTLWSLPCPNVPEMHRLLCCCVGMI